jgi:hypothetical protein
VKFVQGRKERSVDFSDSGNVHGSGETKSKGILSGLAISHFRRPNLRVVGTLRHVDVVVGMNRLLAAQFSAQDLDGSVGDDLVDVHVGLSTRTGLENDQGEVVDKLARDDLVSGVADGLNDLGVET